MTKRIVILFDGTGNEPGLKDGTNVVRLFDLVPSSEKQLVWYDAGIGTTESSRALTSIGRRMTKVAGLAFGYGLKDNMLEAYRFLMSSYVGGDGIYILGFSRGAYTARALAGMLYQVGLLRPTNDHLLSQALKHFWWDAKKKATTASFREADAFSRRFAREDFRRRRKRSIDYVGLWDTVNATGYVRPRLVLPWTAEMPMARVLRHAVSINERRRPYRPTLISEEAQTERGEALREAWFAGVHSDVGGTFEDDHDLADISLEWIVDGAVESGLDVDADAYAVYKSQPESNATGTIHDMGWKWRLMTIGFRRTITPDNARIHESALVRERLTGRAGPPYIVRLPGSYRTEPWVHRDGTE